MPGAPLLSEPGPIFQWRMRRHGELAACVVSSLTDGRIVLDLLIGPSPIATEMFHDAGAALDASDAHRDRLTRDGWEL
jgi:hypothetical protein